MLRQQKSSAAKKPQGQTLHAQRMRICCFHTVLLCLFLSPCLVAFCPTKVGPKQSLLWQQQQQQLGGWYPRIHMDQDDVFDHDESLLDLEQRSVQLAADLIREGLKKPVNSSLLLQNETMIQLVRGRFMDLTCTRQGELALEGLFGDDMLQAAVQDWGHVNVICGAVMTLQSLCAMGTQVGVMGAPEKLRRMVAHLDDRNDVSLLERDLVFWDRDSVRRLKYRLDKSPAMELLAKLLWRRTPQGAFDLLVSLGVWDKHEDLALLRSGFPLRFTEQENQIAQAAFNSTHDPDAMLGIRQDFRNMKVYTIDSASTCDIDDGLSVERVPRADGSQGHRIWIHVADADRWAPRNSPLFEIARQRVTSLYLPNGSIPMFPSCVSFDLMSLTTNQDCCALSLGVELNDDGSIDPESVILTPSIIRVTYRLTYDEVDEMLAEGIAYNEEWELGALLSAATRRRSFRIANGAMEGKVPNPIPTASVTTFANESALDGIGISLHVQVTNNGGRNQTNVSQDEDETTSFVEAVSSARLLVTEAMILAGESLGHWKSLAEKDLPTNGEDVAFTNSLRLGFRTQPKPDLKSRSQERRILMNLLEYNVGGGYCHAWYMRRFMEPVKVTETKLPHAGLGLSSYVQWTSPIRRFGDLQVHASLKRFMRRKKIYEMIRQGLPLPTGLSASDLGFAPTAWDPNGKLIAESIDSHSLDQDINFLQGVGLLGAARTLQRQSQQYWIFEYIRRLWDEQPDKTYEAIVLGCTDPTRDQFAIYLVDFGFEHRYTSPSGRLDSGTRLQLRVDKVLPRSGILYFVRAF